MYTIEHKVAHLSVEEYVRDYRDEERFIDFCKACERYNTCWACPPFDYDTSQYITPYSEAYIIGTKLIVTEEAMQNIRERETIFKTMDQMMAEGRKVIDPQLLQLEEKYTGRAFYAGTCHICPMGTCARKEGKPCIAPARVRPSLESLGFDIGKTTTELLDIELKWSQRGHLPEYLTLVSGFFTTAIIPSLTFED